MPARDKTLPSFGEKLKKEREKRSITLEQISLSTKIGTRMLQALEEDKFSQLPGGIFNKGFVRAYARHVGLDEDQIVADYLEASGEAPPPPSALGSEAQPVTIESRPSSSPSKPLPWGLFAAVLLVVALVLSVWSRRQHTPERIPAPPPATQKPVGTTAPALSETQAQPATDSAAPKTETPVPPKVDSTSITAPKAISPVPKAAPSTDTAAASTSQPDEFTVVVLAREDSWLNITADGKTTFSNTLSAGNQQAVHARNQVQLKTGNTGALDFVFNGKKLPAQGEYGQVKTITFGSDGLLPAAPTTPAVQ